MKRCKIDPKEIDGWKGCLYLQGRHACSLAAITHYVIEFLEGRGAEIRPIQVQRSTDTGLLFLDEGHHRLTAALLTRQSEIEAEIYDEFEPAYLDKES